MSSEFNEIRRAQNLSMCGVEQYVCPLTSILGSAGFQIGTGVLVISSAQENQFGEKHTSEQDESNKSLILRSESRRQNCTHNDMNRLQSISLPGRSGSPGRVFVSLNPTRLPDSIQYQRTYHHPLIASTSVQATRKLHLITGQTISALRMLGWVTRFMKMGSMLGQQLQERQLQASMKIRRAFDMEKILRRGHRVRPWGIECFTLCSPLCIL